MYSGSDSTESQNYSQWALNPSTYQNMSNEQVDWAALAQQWIIMKEAGPPPLVPPEQKSKPKKEPLNEGGEAPMDVENDREDSDNWTPGNDWNWNTQNQTWGWSNAWTPPTGVPPPVPMKPPLLPTPANYNQYGAPPPESSSDNASFGGYNTTPNNDYSQGYWTSAGSSKQIKPHNRRFSKVNVPRPVQPVIPETQPALDAAKRKQLPAWIREGLEKMERDKQKQLEREKEKQEREEYNEKIKQSEKETMEILKSTIKEQQRSKFESDGEYSDEESQNRKKPEPVPLTPAEQMLNVRRTMTEILLKVTNREIETICREELQRHHKKYKASDHRVSAPSGANVTARLGLGIYGGGSGSSSASEESGDEAQDQKDSDAELKDVIKRKMAEFSKTEREIEDKLAEAERNKRNSGSRSPTPDTNDIDTQVDAKGQGVRKQHHHSRTATTNTSTTTAPSSAAANKSSSKRRTKSRSSSSSSSTSRRRHSSSSSSPKSKKRHSPSRTPPSRRTSNKSSKKRDSRSRSRSSSRQRRDSERRYASRRTRSRSRSRRSRSSSYSSSRRRRSRSRNRRSSRSPAYSKSSSRKSRSRSRSSRRKRSRSSSSSGRGKRSRRR